MFASECFHSEASMHFVMRHQNGNLHSWKMTVALSDFTVSGSLSTPLNLACKTAKNLMFYMEFYGQMKQGTATTLSALRDYIFLSSLSM